MAISKTIAALLLAWLAVFATAQTRSAPRPHQPTAEERAADDLKDAEDLLQKQQYQQAEDKLLAIIPKEESNPQAWFDLGFAQGQLGKTAEAIKAYKKATELSPKWFEAQQNLGLMLVKSGDFPAAAAALNTAVTLKPGADADLRLSMAWFSLGRATEDDHPQEALSAYQKAVELNPANDEAVLGVARMNERSGNLAGVEQQYLKLAESGNDEAVGSLVNLYLKQKRYADAETWLRKYMSANPGNVAAQAELGKLLAAQGKTQEAIAALEPVYKSSADPKLARELASLYLDTKQYDAAAPLLGSLVAKNSNDAELHRDYGAALVHLHKYPEAQTELIKALQLNSQLVEAYFDLAYAAQQNKQHELVIRVLDARAKLHADTPATYFLRAEAYDSLRMYKPAAANYRQFLAVAGGKYPDQEFQARHRLKAIEPN
jgi:tetratricopeptide (TPR) repeat protein